MKTGQEEQAPIHVLSHKSNREGRLFLYFPILSLARMYYIFTKLKYLHQCSPYIVTIDNEKKHPHPSFRFPFIFLLPPLTFTYSFIHSMNIYGVFSVPPLLCCVEGKLRAVKSRGGSRQEQGNQTAGCFPLSPQTDKDAVPRGANQSPEAAQLVRVSLSARLQARLFLLCEELRGIQ